MDRRAWQALVDRVVQSQTQLKQLNMHTQGHTESSFRLVNLHIEEKRKQERGREKGRREEAREGERVGRRRHY